MVSMIARTGVTADTKKSSRFAKPDANWYSAGHAARQGQIMGLKSATLRRMAPFFRIRLNCFSSSIGDAAASCLREMTG
jgi:hypothetical protein